VIYAVLCKMQRQNILVHACTVATFDLSSDIEQSFLAAITILLHYSVVIENDTKKVILWQVWCQISQLNCH